MEVSQLSLARMLLSCFLGGVLMGLVYEILLLPRLLLFGALSPAAQRLQGRMTLPDVLCPWRCSKEKDEAKARHKHRGKRFGSALLLGVADTLFCLLCAVLLLLLLYVTNHGELRVSALLSLLLGVLLCRMTLLRLLSCTIQCTYVLLRAVLVWMVALLSYPLLRAVIALWHRTAPLRRRIKRKFIRYKENKVLRAAQRKNKKEYSDITSSNIESAEPFERPAPDGRRVFCVGTSHSGRRSTAKE